jgi:hypothetical protein
MPIVLDVIGGGDGPSDAHQADAGQALNMASRRASISSSSINSPRSAATNPFSTAARKRASSARSQTTTFVTKRSGTVPL